MNHLKYIASCVSLACLPLAGLYANPDGGVVVNGSASFSQQGNTLNITNTPGTIINWQQFSIQSGETTRFIQQSTDSAVLNRVVGQDPSQILGQLQSNGRVFLINPNGILFGQGSVIDVNGLVASTLKMSDADFLSKNLNFSGDGSDGTISNQGTITTAEGGFVYLIAPDIENSGVITSPKGEVLLAAGHSVQLVNSANPDIRVKLTAPDGQALNVGEIITKGGKTSIYAGLINQQGTVNADSAVADENGNIFFKASKHTTLSSNSITTANGTSGGRITIKTTEGLTEVSGEVSATGSDGDGGEIQILGNQVGIIENAKIDASGLKSGGTVLIGGSNKGANPDIQNATATYVGRNTNVRADAGNNGDGGTVIVWSDETTRAYGTIRAQGGKISGNGGYVETSGGYLDVSGLNLDVSATNGNGGTWLLDPYNITISATTTVNTTAGPTYTPTATGSNILNSDINTQLNAGTAVIVDTTGVGGENGDITVNAAISKTSGAATSLTLKAHNNIITNSSISSSTGALDITLLADQDSNNTGSVTLNNTLNSLNGNITITSAGDVTLNSGTNTINAGTGTAILTSNLGAIIGDPMGAPTDITANTVQLNAANGINANGGAAQFTTKATSLAFNNSGTGLVRIHNSVAGAATVSGSNNSGDIIIQNSDSTNTLTVGNITASNGLISLNSDIIDITGNVNAGSNTVYLKNFVNNAAISVGGSALFDISSTELANISAGNIQIGKDTFGNYAGAATIASSSAVNMGGKNVWITAQNGISFSANNITNSGGQLYADNITSGNITTGSGVITADNVQFRSIGNINIGSGGITSTAAGNIYLLAADVNISGSVNAGTNNVFLAPYLSGTAMSIGGSQTFDLTTTDLTNITSNSITIGENLSSAVYASTIDVASSAAVNIGAKTLKVHSNGNITFGANNFTATGGDINFKSDAGTITTGSGLVSSDILVLEAPGLISVGTGGLTTTNYSGLNGGNVYISGTVTSPIFYLSIFTPGSTIGIGSGQAYNIAQADIDFINATTTYIGNNPYVNNTGFVDMGSAASIDFANRTVVIKSDNGMVLGANPFKATGGNLTFTSVNSGFDITTGTGNVAANTLSFNSGRDIIVGSGGLNALGAISLNAANSITQNGNLTSNGSGVSSLTATSGNIVMAAATTTTSGSANLNYSAGGYMTLNLLDSGTANTTLNAGTNIIDQNGAGVNNIKANNLTVSSGGNADLDYQITGTLNASGVVGVPNLRTYPATGGTSTTEPLVITLATVTNTTNSIITDTTITSTTETTAPLSDTTTTGNTDDPTSTTSDEDQVDPSAADSTKDKTKTKVVDAKKLPICK